MRGLPEGREILSLPVLFALDCDFYLTECPGNAPPRSRDVSTATSLHREPHAEGDGDSGAIDSAVKVGLRNLRANSLPRLDGSLEVDISQHDRELHKDLKKHQMVLGSIMMAQFKIRTVQEAYNLSHFLANYFPEPERVVSAIYALTLNAIEHGVDTSLVLCYTHHQKT